MSEVSPSLNGTIQSEPTTRITALSVEGFKSIDAELSLELNPLTILAGTNSSGKSSALQPLLLLKQTLEAPYDPGPLLLNGPNVEFTSVSQFLCMSKGKTEEGTFSFGGVTQVEFSGNTKVNSSCKTFFRKNRMEPLELEKQVSQLLGQPESGKWEFIPRVTELENTQFRGSFSPTFFGKETGTLYLHSTRSRCFIRAVITPEQTPNPTRVIPAIPWILDSGPFANAIIQVIHVPGLRGNPKRNYPVTAVGDRFPGTFEKYVATIVAYAQNNRHRAFLNELETDLRELGLAWHIEARAVDDAQVELLVNRLPAPNRSSVIEVVNIADVGFGVSQTLPVVVALLTAKPGQLVFIEQPEIHLHPRAQVAMAGLLARAANRGVQVVIETHSSLLLLGIQRLVADETLDPAKVKLHWFTRNETTGLTNVTSGSLDPAGAFGDWPEDFDDVILSAQQQYLDAAEKKLAP